VATRSLNFNAIGISMLKTKKRGIALLVVACCLMPLGYLGAIQIDGNFHAVVTGAIYRSAQPSASDITSYVKNYGIRSIINLRGANSGQSWYDDELHASQTLRIRHIDFRMSASKELTDAQVSRLADLMEKAPKSWLGKFEQLG
jgi:protein tyrosine/serine phosphatase